MKQYTRVFTALVLATLLSTPSITLGNSQNTTLDEMLLQLKAIQTQIINMTSPDTQTTTAGLLQRWRDSRTNNDTATTSSTASVKTKAPNCSSFTSVPNDTIKSGKSVTLQWITNNANTVTIDNGIGNVNRIGQVIVRPTTTTTYTLTATNTDNQKVTCSVTVPVINSAQINCDGFKLSSSTINQNESTTLSWNFGENSFVTIDNKIGFVKSAGSKIISPNKTTTYTASILGIAGKTLECKVTVQVSTVQPALDLSFCAYITKTAYGTLCAIKPSVTDTRINDMSPGTGEGGVRVADDNEYGFGYHVFAVPNEWKKAKGVWVHLSGSYGRPYDQNLLTAADPSRGFSDQVWLNELMEQGYAVIQLAYDNRFSVNGDLCGKNDPGYMRDNCSGEVREITLTGTGNSPYRTTDTFNSIDNRLKAVVGYLEGVRKIELPDTISASKIDWGKLDISGHSQGATQAYYIAKKRQVNSVCIMSGGYDGGDGVNQPGSPDVADWMKSKQSSTQTSRMGALLATTDDSFRAYNQSLSRVIGLSKTQIIIDNTDPYSTTEGRTISGHAATVKDPTLKQNRLKACF